MLFIGLAVGFLVGFLIAFLFCRRLATELMSTVESGTFNAKGLIRHFFLVDNGVDLTERQEKEVERRQNVILDSLFKLLDNPSKSVREHAKLMKELRNL